MCCDWQLLADQPSAQSNGARPCTLAATKHQLSHSCWRMAAGYYAPLINWSPFPVRHLWWAVLAVSHWCGWWQFSSAVSYAARAGVFSWRGWHENVVTCSACCRSRAWGSHCSLSQHWCGNHCLGTCRSDISALLILQTGTAQRMRHLDLSTIRAHLPNNVATLKSLIGMHSLTGCGSTSTFLGGEEGGVLNFWKHLASGTQCR